MDTKQIISVVVAVASIIAAGAGAKFGTDKAAEADTCIQYIEVFERMCHDLHGFAMTAPGESGEFVAEPLEDLPDVAAPPPEPVTDRPTYKWEKALPAPVQIQQRALAK